MEIEMVLEIHRWIGFFTKRKAELRILTVALNLWLCALKTSTTKPRAGEQGHK